MYFKYILFKFFIYTILKTNGYPTKFLNWCCKINIILNVRHPKCIFNNIQKKPKLIHFNGKYRVCFPSKPTPSLHFTTQNKTQKYKDAFKPSLNTKCRRINVIFPLDNCHEISFRVSQCH